MRLAIVLVCYNGRRWLDLSLGSCRTHAARVPLFVVDNGSSDGSADYVAEHFSEVTLLRQHQNLGFAAGNNVGISAALTSDAEAVFLLNQDAELTAGALEALVRYLDSHPKVAAVQPAIFLPNGRVNSLGNSYHYLGFGEAGGNGLTEEEARRSLPWLRAGDEPPYLSGSAVLIRATAVNQVGLLDEALFMYHEDLEFCLRLRLAGWQLAVAPAAKVIHHYEPGRSLRQFYYMERNRYVVWLSYFKLPTVLLLLIPWLVSELLLMLVAVARGWAGVRLRAYANVLTPASWLGIHRRRQRLAKLRQVSDRELLRHAVPIIQSVNKGGWVTSYIFNPMSAALWHLLLPLIRW